MKTSFLRLLLGLLFLSETSYKDQFPAPATTQQHIALRCITESRQCSGTPGLCSSLFFETSKKPQIPVPATSNYCIASRYISYSRQCSESPGAFYSLLLFLIHIMSTELISKGGYNFSCHGIVF